MSKRLLYFLSALLIAAPLLAAAQSQSIPTNLDKPANYYPFITFLSQGGPSDTLDGVDNKKGDIESIAFRVIITTSEIYSNLHFEKISYGAEGCCAKVVWSHKLDMQTFGHRFKIMGELTGLEFIKWLSPISFQFKMGRKQYMVEDISKTVVKIRQI